LKEDESQKPHQCDHREFL